MTTQTTPITETNHFIILDKYTPLEQSANYQTESDLEREFIQDLTNQGYEYRTDLNSQEKLLANVREQLQRLNHVIFTDGEWKRFVEEYLDKPSENLLDKTRKIHHNHIYDFVFDTGRIQNIYLLDKKNIANNKLQVINQFEQTGTHANRYDVTILVNGLPLVQVELKKRGVAIREAFNQIHRYSKESFNSENSLFKYLQVFVISNGTDTRYFANTTKRDKNSFDFTMNWAKSDNSLIKDLKDFTATFFQKNTLLKILIDYSVFDVSDTLLLMRPYQIAATERILWKIKSTYLNKNWSNVESGGFIWHTTGSGKTLTSFKAARLATELPFIDKVFFVVDRKDLDYQTMKEYQRFSPDSVNGSESTAGLKRNLDKEDNKIIVTTIQKLNNLMKSEENLAIYQKQVVFIFDECHRSQFGEAQKNLKKKFKKFCQFGFTGTPIFPDEIVDGKLIRKGNALGAENTQSVFGRELHSYVITDAIRDEKVLKFKVDYNDVRPTFKDIEQEKDLEKLTALEAKKAFLHPERIREITQYILDNFKYKTHRINGGKGFNAMFAVSSVDAAKLYYQAFKRLQQAVEKPLKVATIFSFTANEEQNAVGDIVDESFDTEAMDLTAKAFLTQVMADYNQHFKSNFSIEKFQEYYRDLAKRVKNQEIDLLIVVGMFLTGFDAPGLNTLFVDKNLRYHGLMQAFSRTNRIHGASKPFGNVVSFRDLEQATLDAIALFGNSVDKQVVLQTNYQEELYGEKESNKRGYIAIVQELQEKFPSPNDIATEADKKAFVKLFGEYLKVENVLKNYDEFTALQAYQMIDNQNSEAIRQFQERYHLTDDELIEIQNTPVLSTRVLQDSRSMYYDIRDWLRQQNNQPSQSNIDWSDVVFEVELLKSQEINLDFILELIFNHHKQHHNKTALAEEIRRTVRASMAHRAKESLIVDFVEQADLGAIKDKATMIEKFYAFAQKEQAKEAQTLIDEEKLNDESAKRYLVNSLKRGFASDNGTELNAILPKMSPLNPSYLTKKQGIFKKIQTFVEKFKGIGNALGLFNQDKS